LNALQTVQRPARALASRMLAMAVAPMLLNGRGFDGLNGPNGAWLGALGTTAYMPATLDKTLAELGLLQSGQRMWRAHARHWHQMSERWAGPDSGWLRSAVYIDGTADPYWTQSFAKSGKVSRVGRVMPCLSRVAIHSSAGVPLLIETHQGAVSLKKRLQPMLDELDAAIGADAKVKRLTVVDSEAGNAGLLYALQEQARATYITVLKGQVLAGAKIHDRGEWQPYRDRDQVREVDLTIRGKGAPERQLRLRGVEMERCNSRRAQRTMFVTNAPPSQATATDVADAYLLRWPAQEHRFRTARAAGALSRSHGYGGGQVDHVALLDKVERAERAVEAATRRVERGDRAYCLMKDSLQPGPVQRAAVELADARLSAAEQQLQAREAALRGLQTTPSSIHARDTGRDSIMTCLKMTALMLVDYVLKEYFGGLHIEWRTFIDQLVTMPVTVRSSRDRCVFQVRSNPRNPKLMAQLAAAVAEINGRSIRRGEQLLVFEISPVSRGCS
jgi:hypothetical protein